VSDTETLRLLDKAVRAAGAARMLLAGDYGVEAAVVPAEVAITIERAEEFHRAALRLIEEPP
jgi:stage V sporulation protein SpoVS